MNACKLKVEAIGGAVRLLIGKPVEVREGGGGFVWVNVGVNVDVLAACNLEISDSG